MSGFGKKHQEIWEGLDRNCLFDVVADAIYLNHATEGFFLELFVSTARLTASCSAAVIMTTGIFSLFPAMMFSQNFSGTPRLLGTMHFAHGAWAIEFV